MGTFHRVPLWILLVILGPINAQEYGDYTVDETIDYTVDETLQGQQQQQQQQQQQEATILLTGPPKISVIPVASNTLVRAINTAHNNRVCSTWGNFHFKNFDGDIFYFPGTCNYIYASHCKSTYEDFNIQIRRTVVDNVPVIDKITMKLDGLVVQINHNTVTVNGKDEVLPFSGSGIQIEKFGVYLSVTSKLGLVFMWNDDDSLLLELNDKYANQTCGLCGDFNGISIHNEFISNGIQITESQFGNLQKLDGPTEQCQDVPPTPKSNCTDYENICESILMGSAFLKCHSLVAVGQYIEACVQDLCRCDSKTIALCLCDTFAEYSRQCAHAGGEPENWRSKDLCPKTCPYNMQYQECGSSCADTCSNPERSNLCENHCLEGCFCPPGTVFDDINNSGCVPLEKCSCTFNSKNYAAGTSYSTHCSTCVCSAGKWSCNDLPCPATCSIDGGSHITTYDQTHYNIHGDCNYVLTKDCKGNSFIILTELRKCGLTESETCLKSATVILNGGETIIVIKPCGSVFVNSIYTQLPVSPANVTIFRPSSFYIVVETNLGVQLVAQLTPFMQVYVVMDPSYKGQTCGLCGNFNDKQTDDFQTINGVIEGSAASFANTWKTQADCSNVKNVYEDPCSLSVENEAYAQHWCGLISDPSGPFAACHATVNPQVYQQNCMFDTCNCEKSEACMCASLSSYVRACAVKGVIVTDWRRSVCSKYMDNCPKTLTYTYSTSTCPPTCRSLSEPDVTCSIKITPVDGCVCAKGYYMDDSGKCVPAEACPCYYKGSAVPTGEVVYDNGIMCTCSQGKLSCIGTVTPACTAPMVYFDCKNASVGTKGAECQKSCQTLDMACYSAKCVSGCVCPAGLVSDGKGGCIKEEQCPCIHNDATYQHGKTIKMKCNTCTCKDRMWQCTNERCLATCAVYGDGHYITFDGKRYSFNGDCEYSLVQDYCGKGGNSSSFRVITENIPCGTTGTTCSKSIKIFLGTYELILTEEHIEVLERDIGGVAPYKVRHMGIYLVIEADNGLILIWDRRTSIFIKLSKDFEGAVCGLCGNYDGNGNNDFTTRSQSMVGDVIEFGNSWKISPTCPDAKEPKDACSVNPYRKSWAQKQCSIINSQVFSACHAQVDPSKYYDSCVTDTCACDSGGDCECFCTAVAAYAQACGESGICVSWRTPSICPLFCDYYNPEGECEWHYKPCGAPCIKTCRNPSGKCIHELSGLEGCYPSCPAAKPFFDEEDMECVAQCGCYDDEDNHYKVGQLVPSKKNCVICTCTMSGVECKYQAEACHCEYQGKMYNYNDVIYNTTDGIGGCFSAICKENGTIYRDIDPRCGVTTTPFTFSSTHLPTTTKETTTSLTTICVKEVCQWSQWFDVSYPEEGMKNGDFDTYDNIRAKGYSICNHPQDIQCRAEKFPNKPLAELEQNVQCNASFGLICLNKQQLPPICYNYQIRVKCCSFERCDTNITTPSTAPTTTQPTPTTEITHPTTTPSTTTVTTSSTLTTTVSTTTSPTPTVCHPKCTWTNWIDVHLPGVGKDEGDFETYERIRAAGHKLCAKPDGIQCRAEKFPSAPISRIGQVVQCNLTFGLVCNNEDQDGDSGECLNYQIKVLCCDDYSHCEQLTTPGSTTTLSTTTETTTPSSTISTTAKTPPTTKTTTVSTTTPETKPTPETTTTETTTTPLTTTSTTTPETTTTSTTVSTTTETTTTPLPTTSTTTRKTTTTPETTKTPETTTATATTTSPICQPQCKWTHWIDFDTPTSGLDGGDKETFENIMTKDKQICKHPQNIECRAEDFPDISIDNVGQVVKCDMTVGLVCNNKDQPEKVKQCYNYQIKVLCCDDYSHCSTTPPQTTPTSVSTATTTTTETQTTTTTLSTTTKSTTSETPKHTTTTEFTKTTKCFCRFDNKYFSPGEVIYNKTDAAGCSFYAVCNDFCEAERFTGPCTPTTTPSTTKSRTTSVKSTTTTVPYTTASTTTPEKTTSTTTTTTIVSTTVKEGCPPKQTNETWLINNCTVATCHGNDVVTFEQVKCPPVEPLSCANGFPPLIKTTADGCCEYSECECVCGGWGDPHYITFDGTYYTFLDNCTYVLVQQITPKYDNFRVLVDNYFCNTDDGLSCPQSILIYYKSTEIVLTRMMYQGRMKNRIRFNQEWVTPGFTKDDITVTSAGINMNVEIPEIGAFISFSGMIFVIKLPFSKFGYNTEGQCGTCSNNTTEDCRMPSGKIVQDCSEMAYHWKVNVTDKPYCNVPPTPPPSKPTPPPTCPPSALCDIILSEVFTECHKIISPKPYHEGCAYDACRIRNDSVQCSSLEIYASLCTANGICVDWRDKTKGLCPYSCPAGKVYNACGPMHVKTCDSKEVQNLSPGYTEGCYCPEGSTLFNSYTDVCVKSCSCVGPEGMPKGPGETWTSNCKQCTCEKNSLTVQCQSLTCPQPVNATCEKEGFIPVELPDPEQPCCMKKKCRPMEVCIFDDVLYKTNETWLINNCTVATCHENNVVTIEQVKCPPVDPLSCANGFPPLIKTTADGCCEYSECECVCSGWGDPHYITFDGTYYTFLDNCTYVLVQQITPKYDNFRVLVDNYFCNTDDGLSCPQSILIYYKSTEIVLTRMMYQGRMKNRIRFNQDWVTPGFTKDDITVTSAGINMNVEIPEIGAFISFSGMIFVIKLPFSKFGYNTEGQCGTCSNNTTEDCRMPSGKIVQDCSKMAYHWKVNVTNKPYCNVPPTPPPSMPTPPPTCPPSALCDIILSEVFAECHKIIPPKPYHEGCAYDACRIRNDSVQCSSLEIYASLCTANGICVDWRDKTKGHCPYSCPAGKVYNACGAMHVKTCDSKEVQNLSPGYTEGCYCPEGSTLFNSYTDVCVKSCSCVGPEGMPKGPGETWTSNCKQCTCEKNSLTVQCQALTCPQPVNVTCEKEGFIPVELPDPEQPCCMKKKCRPMEVCIFDDTLYKTNETWLINNCTVATCHENNVVTIEQVKCPLVDPLSCANGFPPLIKTTADGCCEYSECECVCSGWGDPHYITFDGTYYTFLDNCTYVLVQQITPKYDNFRVLVDNYFCNTDDGLSCPQSILIYYKSTEIVLTRMMYQGRMKNRIRFNQDWVTPGFTKDDITVTSAGINMNVEIPEIGAFISFSGMIFVIKLPFSKFGYNTEGQCGTCSNNSTEDCRMPSGKIVQDCSEMSYHWKVNVTNKPYCNVPPTPPPSKPTPPPTCPPSALCDVILSEVFAECHKIIPPKPYHEGCAYDACRIRNDSVQCSSLEIYASLCTANGICVDWRDKTKGLCPYNCPAGKVYNACGAMHVKTCDSKEVQNLSPGYTEGCYCPEGSTLFNSYTDVCVKSCSCVGPEGMPKGPGETWTSNCKQCTCEKNSLTVQCQPLTCPQPVNATCEKEGFIPVELPDPEQPCCMKKKCHDCKPMEVCVFDDVLYKTNETWLINNCTVATCHENNVVTIEQVKCPPADPLSCANGFPPQIKTTADGCCEYSECECVCSGWGDPHYITFDGTYYTFLDNCTYVLVQQITPKYDNFRVLVDNYFCNTDDGLSCPQSILIYYKSTEIVLTRMMYQGRMKNRIRFNQDWVTPGFTKDDITVTSAGINMNVEIPEIGAFISFSGMIFVIKLPFSKFGYNTEGQCGTCSNNSTEDCRMPSGKIVQDCSEMAYHWKVNVTNKPYCNVPPTPPPSKPTPPPTCPPSALCDIILSEVFAECHKIIPPKPYHEGCAYDACRIRNDSVQCSSLEIYASLCTANGICVDWRDKTKGLCPYSCPAGKVYNACGPMNVKTCDSKEVQNLSPGYSEGCYCPEGSTLFNSYTDVCVKSCSCVGPEGMPKGPGETWTSNCKQCTCEKNSLTVQCQALTCPQPVNVTCEKEGFIPVELPDPEQPCCMKKKCQPMEVCEFQDALYKTNETWLINNCTVATCHGDNVVNIQQVKCPPVEPLSCANGFPPLIKTSADGCCEYSECECVCSGWGDPHYITFDGTYYTFLDNCTYVLVQQITPKYDNFRVLVDNYFCNTDDGLSCPQSILIYYKSTEIVLTRMMYQGRMKNRIRFNQDWVTPGFTKDDITVTSAGINMNVEIPEIGAFISFSGMIFVIKLPFSKFGYNTEGQCGTCSNNTTEDCRMPSGEIVQDCSEMAYHWKVNVTNKPYCNVPPTPPPSMPTPPPTCPPSALCDIILSEVFAECHKFIPPEPYHEGCAYDACRIRNDSVQCSSLEIYASLCTANGICVDWRDKTKGNCPYSCPPGKVYNACGAMHVKTCDSKEVQNLSPGYTEGCYCPEGSTLFNSYTDVCVKSCSCVGPEGMPKGPGETWTSNCKQCTCEKNSLSVQCQSLTCPQPVNITCEKEGFIPVEFPDPEQPCCMKNECRCNSSFCPEKVKSCPLGFEVVPVLLAGDCCPSYDCTALSGCKVQKQSQLVKTSTCESDQVVELSYCRGACMTSSKYSAEANTMEHQCSCCQEVKTSKREVNLKCLDGTSTVYTYIYADECGCTHTECESDTQTSSSQQHQQVQSEQQTN